MKIGVFKTLGLATLLAGLACLSFVSGQQTKAPASESPESLRGRAEKGDAEAQFNLGFMYHFGQGVTPDYAEALRWYRKAADLGNVSAQFNLGSMYDFGEGVPQNYAEAVRWYRRAADQGDVRAQFNLGNMYAQGQGAMQDYVEAHMWMNLAASHATGDDQKRIADVRDAVTKKMTPQQIAEAQRRAREWKPKTAQVLKEPNRK